MNNIKIVLIFLIFASCQSNINVAEVELENENIELGFLSIGDTISKSIIIRNVGKNEFKIDSVGVSCGCTLVNYSKLPISQNQSAEIKIEFIPDRKGKFSKSIVVEANTDPPFNIFNLKGEVK